MLFFKTSGGRLVNAAHVVGIDPVIAKVNEPPVGRCRVLRAALTDRNEPVALLYRPEEGAPRDFDTWQTSVIATLSLMLDDWMVGEAGETRRAVIDMDQVLAEAESAMGEQADAVTVLDALRRDGDKLRQRLTLAMRQNVTLLGACEAVQEELKRIRDHYREQTPPREWVVDPAVAARLRHAIEFATAKGERDGDAQA